MTMRSKPLSIVLLALLAACSQPASSSAQASRGALPGPPLPVAAARRAPTDSGQVKLSFAPVAKKAMPAVVNISVTENQKASPMADQEDEGDDQGQDFRQSPFDEMLRRFFDQQGQNNPFEQGPGQQGPDEGSVKRIALGSGFIIDADGHVVTNKHVVGDASKVEVTLQDGDKYTANIIGTDARTDLAVLKIDAGKPLPYVSFGNSDDAQIGDWVVAVGNPCRVVRSLPTEIV